MSAPQTHDPLVVNTQDGCCWTRRAVNRAGRGLYALADVQGPVPELVLATLHELAEHGLSSMADALPVPVGAQAHERRERYAKAVLQVKGLAGLFADVRPHVDPVMALADEEMAELRARVAELEAERHTTNEALSDAAERMRADRDRIAELEALTPAAVQTCRKCGAGYTYGQPCSTCLFQAQMTAATAVGGCPRNVIDGDVGGHFFKVGAFADGPRRCMYCGASEVNEPSPEGEFYGTLHHAYDKGRDLPPMGGQS